MANGEAGTLELIGIELSRGLELLAGRLHDTHHALIFLGELGLDFPEQAVTPALDNALQELHKASHALPDARQALLDAITAGDTLNIIAKGVALAKEVALIIDAGERLAHQLGSLGSAPGVSAADLSAFVAALPRRLAETILIEYLQDQRALTASALSFVGLIDQTYVNLGSTNPGQPGFLKTELRLDRVAGLLKSPDNAFKEVYGWGAPNFDAGLLLRRFADLLQALRVPITQRVLPGAPPRPAFEVCVATIAPTPQGTAPSGLDFLLALDIGDGISIELPIGPGLRTRLATQGNLGAKAGIRVQPPGTLTITPPSGTAQGKLTTGVTRIPSPGSDAIRLLSIAGGTGLSAQRIELGLVSEFQWDQSANAAKGGFGFEGQFRGGKLKISLDGADGFLGMILSGVDVQADFDVGVQWTPGGGVSFSGSSALAVQLPTHISLGPVDLTAVTLTVGLDGGAFPIGLTTNIKASLGPLAASVEELGAAVEISFAPNQKGDVGPLNLKFAFKPPKGVGLSLDAGVVVGGGYLFIDPDHGRYAGALQLMFADFLAVSAIGVIETKMPDGSPGFSLLLIVSADFGPGIQLGFGFTLLAVGGLLGLNRSAIFQAIADGVRTNAISSVMFPTDVVANAPRIISDLEAFFPAQEGTFLIGPMAKIGWGEPTLISLALGVIIEIPPGDFAIIGVLRAALPAADLPILNLQANFIGAFEFSKQRLWFYASLYDSHLLFITIDGSMGVLFDYSSNANFLISVGGFHPQFAPPPLPFPSPTRISISIVNESFARIHADGYFAVTTNTVQFGTHSDYFFGFDSLNVQGSSSFDALIQFSPFHFVVSFSTTFSVNVFGVGAFGVGIALTVSGPGRWHATGTASISLLFFDIGVNIDVSWGDDQPAQLPPVAVMPLLTAEFQKQSNWRAVPPPSSTLLVSLRKLDPSEAQFVLHPLGALQVSQRLAPLDLTLDSFGSQKPSDANRFSLSALSPGLMKSRDIPQLFPKAQFVALDDAAKLSEPAYEPFDSGIELAVTGNAYASGTAITRVVRYDVTIIDTKLAPVRIFIRFFNFTAGLFKHLLRGASVTLSPLSNFHAAQTHPFKGSVSIAPETFAVALVSNNSVFHSEAASFTSAAAANDYLNRAVNQDPNLAGAIHVLPHFELAA